MSTKDDRELKGGGHPKGTRVVGGGVGEENEGGKGGGGGGEEEEVMLGGRVVNCSIFAGNLNAN